ncbi:hypothetical protein QR685DRAFT_527719 [Neurospora intermedia]|uniref:Secreted protein n=1 Tax=Neurospora intermedia TaxID=5142 RepID=A0ABR3DAX6_NEUIN
MHFPFVKILFFFFSSPIARSYLCHDTPAIAPFSFAESSCTYLCIHSPGMAGIDNQTPFDMPFSVICHAISVGFGMRSS